MSSVRLATHASFAALSLALAACGGGGGGVGSTPNPPAPTPAPGPTPTPGPAPTPTPTPAPTPAPSAGANDDLLPTLVSESFTNTAVRATASFNATTGQQTAGSTQPITATISYNSANQSYTLSTPTGSITFGPGDIDNAQSSAGAVAYVKTNGNQTDSLTLTRPGTSGPLTYRYVGGAFWQRTVQTSSTISGSIDSIVYGVETQSGGVPVSGKANYDIDLIGARTTTNSLVGLAGEGTATVDFASGKILVIGDITIGTTLAFQSMFYGSASISSGGTFSGSLVIEDGEVFNGILDGRFFGPNAAEIGAAFRATGPSNMVASGALLGRKGPGDTPNAQFNNGNLSNSETFSALQSRVDFNSPDTPGTVHQTGQFTNVVGGSETIAIRYDDETAAYLLVSGSDLIYYSQDDDRVMGLAGSDWARWRRIDTDTRFLRVGFLESYLPGRTSDYRWSYQVFGMPTSNANLVRTGGAAFRIEVTGAAIDNGYSNPMGFYGEGDLVIGLETGTVTGNALLDYTMFKNDSTIPPQSATGEWTFNGTLSSNANLLSGTVSLSGIGSYSGQGTGQLFGPDMSEVGGVFSASESGGNMLSGAFYGAEDPANASNGGLADLTSQTELRTITDSSLHREGEIISIAYEPDFDGYYVQFKYTADPLAPVRVMRLDPSQRNNSDATHDYYDTALPDRYVNGGMDADVVVERIGDGNPEVALTYMTIGQVFLNRPDAGVALDDYHVFATGLRSAQPPTTGTASYSGILRGFARVETNGANANQEAYTLTGNSAFSVNFGNDSVNGSFSNIVGALLLADDAGTATASRTFSDFSIAATISGDSFTGSQAASGWTRAISGGFFGPDADEVGGIFSADFGTPGSSPQVIEMDGAFAATKN